MSFGHRYLKMSLITNTNILKIINFKVDIKYFLLSIIKILILYIDSKISLTLY